jgi:hypothetical protein
MGLAYDVATRQALGPGILGNGRSMTDILRAASDEQARASRSIEKVAVDPRAARIAFLERKRAATKADLLMKFEDDDYRGVADAAMDLRDIVSELAGLRFGKGQ